MIILKVSTVGKHVFDTWIWNRFCQLKNYLQLPDGGQNHCHYNRRPYIMEKAERPMAETYGSDIMIVKVIL